MGSAFSSTDRLKMRVFLALFSCIAAASASTLLQAQWSQFKADHAKVYSSPAEEALRLSIFAQNVAKIGEQNRAGQSWKSGINQFTDLTKNSWGTSWGEGGYIRLRRQATPQCAIDSSPLDGSGCVDGGVESVEVCGTCAVVSDNSYPLGTTFML